MDPEQAIGALIVKDVKVLLVAAPRIIATTSTQLLTECSPFSGVDGCKLAFHPCLESKEILISSISKQEISSVTSDWCYCISIFRFCIEGYEFIVTEVKGTLVELMEGDHIDVNSRKKILRHHSRLSANQQLRGFTPLERRLSQNSQNHSIPKNAFKEIVLSDHLFSVHPTNERGRFRPDSLSYNVNQGQNAQITIEGLVYSGRSCRVHPQHLHGRSFLVLRATKASITRNMNGKRSARF
ncbi:hypothetical protein DSO57_1018831 [Entomophthora muscae]|uniref:Uncharacterized protein n=1 Tax=Entomophthora muscae TaxID=34485 RepID=A0ACC2TEW1_9FUNG|nr:hypothetical protein DSO57_1018831 [Entomophthora muscae]